MTPHPLPLEALRRIVTQAAAWLRSRRSVAGHPEKLRVAETVSLGDKRFVSVLHVDGKRFLIGGSAAAISLLTQLEDAIVPFNAVLRNARKPRTPSAKRMPKEIA